MSVGRVYAGACMVTTVVRPQTKVAPQHLQFGFVPLLRKYTCKYSKLKSDNGQDASTGSTAAKTETVALTSNPPTVSAQWTLSSLRQTHRFSCTLDFFVRHLQSLLFAPAFLLGDHNHYIGEKLWWWAERA